MRNHQHGGDIYSTPCRFDFSANLNPLGIPEAVKQAACEGVRLSANYPDVNCRALRRELARREGVSPEQIICGNGAAELIFLAVQAVKPKRALLASPGFAEYEQALETAGCEILYYPLREEQGFALKEDYLDWLDMEIDMAFLCNPNNPTGVRTERGLLEQIFGKCKRRDVCLVLDVCFMEFLDVPEESNFIGNLKENPQLFLLKAFTKTYAMAGLRLGYGICFDRDLLERMEKMRQPWSVSLPAQMAGLAALGEDAYVEQARKLIRKERAWLREQLRECGFHVYESEANFLFFGGTPGLAEKCREQGILIRDCANYRGLSEGYYRIAVRTHEENRELIRVLKMVR
ncbi:MAG: pyridoxal phosphate-dependent class II aminotransferase [Eubacteriales bacterium]|nr:pyridoxal phosphate-dependent class II aminotransferase [Eubacteriales bacterium]